MTESMTDARADRPQGPIVTWRDDGKEYYHAYGALSVDSSGWAETWGNRGLDDMTQMWEHWRMATAEEVAAEAVKRAVPQSGNRYKIQIAKTIVKRALLAVA